MMEGIDTRNPRDLEDDMLVMIWETCPRDVGRRAVEEIKRRYEAGETLVDEEILEAMEII